MESHLTRVFDTVLSAAIIVPIIMYFISRMVKLRDVNDQTVKEELRSLNICFKKLETEVMLLGKDIRNEEYDRKLRELSKEFRVLQNDYSKMGHWTSNTIMKLDLRISKIDNKEVEFDEPPLSGKL